MPVDAKGLNIPSEQEPVERGELIVPPVSAPRKGIPRLIPVANSLVSQATNIAKNAGLALLKPKFLVIDTITATEEAEGNNPDNIADFTGIFGLPVFDTITLNELTYTDFNEKEINLGSFRLDIALFEIDLPRNIVRTPVTGRNGDVIEYMSDSNYEIKITGSLVNPLANVPPADLIRALHQYCKAQTEIQVNSTVLAYLDIFSIVIMHAKFMQKAGYRNCFDFELQCISDTPFEIKSAD